MPPALPATPATPRRRRTPTGPPSRTGRSPARPRWRTAPPLRRRDEVRRLARFGRPRWRRHRFDRLDQFETGSSDDGCGSGVLCKIEERAPGRSCHCFFSAFVARFSTRIRGAMHHSDRRGDDSRVQRSYRRAPDADIRRNPEGPAGMFLCSDEHEEPRSTKDDAAKLVGAIPGISSLRTSGRSARIRCARPRTRKARNVCHVPL
jgi:hypothetical protein